MKPVAWMLTVVLLAGCGNSEEEQRAENAAYAIGHELGRNLATSGWQKLDREAFWQGLEAGLASQALERPEVVAAAFRTLQAEGQERLKNEAVAAREAGSTYLAEYLKQEGHQRSALGVGYRILQAGTGAYPQLSDQMQVSYRLETIEGVLIEAVDEEAPISLAFGQLIPAWEEALRQMQVGEERELVVPPEAAYGDLRIAPNAAPGATLRFRLRLHGRSPVS